MRINRNVNKGFVPFREVPVGGVFGSPLTNTIFVRVREVSSTNSLGLNVLNLTTNGLEYASPEMATIPYPNAELFLSKAEP